MVHNSFLSRYFLFIIVLTTTIQGYRPKGKGKIFPVSAMKAYREKVVTATLILNLCIRWR